MNLALYPSYTLPQHLITVLVADDSQAFCSRLAHLLSLIPGVEQVFQATDARSALDGLRTASPAVEIAAIDIHLGDQSGAPLFRRIRREFPDVTLFALTRFASPPIVETYLAAGADACFDKNEELDAMLQAIAQHISTNHPQPQENQP